jgi:spore germination protein
VILAGWGKGRKRFFLKKEAKTFCELAYAVRPRGRPITKVFWFFSSEKNCFLLRHPSAPSLAVLAFCAALAPANAARAAPAIMAYYEGGSSAQSLKRFAGDLQIVAADLYAVDETGKVTGSVPKLLKKTAESDRIQLLITVSNYGAHGFSEKIAHAILTPGKAQNAAIANMVSAGIGYAGVNLDFENVRHTDRAAYTAFTQKLAVSLHQAGQIEVLSVPAETQDNPHDSWSGAYDYAVLQQSADLLQVMTYDENGPWGPSGPVAGLDWVTACLTFTQSVVPAAKISLGLPAYGYDWNLTAGGGKSVSYAAIPALLVKTGGTPQWDAPSSSPWFSYTASNGAAHVVWYENAQSIALKTALATNSAVSGISVFALGFDNADFWQAVLSGFAQ